MYQHLFIVFVIYLKAFWIKNALETMLPFKCLLSKNLSF